jgi:hypothetical protein
MSDRRPDIHEYTGFQRAVTDAFLRVMRARRPDVVWSAREAGEIGEDIPGPDDLNTLPDRPTRAA